MAGISTHVLDNFSGRPGAGMRIDFSARGADGRLWVAPPNGVPVAASAAREDASVA